MEIQAVSTSLCRTQTAARSFSFKGQVESASTPQPKQDTLEISGEGKALSQGMMGKLNALEHSNALASKPQFLKGVLQKMTGEKIGDVDIDALQINRSAASLDATQVNAQVQPGSASLTYEHLSAQATQMNLSVQGTAQSKRGTEMNFSLQLDVRRMMASYTGYSWSAAQSTSGAIDAAA